MTISNNTYYQDYTGTAGNDNMNIISTPVNPYCINAYGGNDYISASSLGDIIFGGTGNDTIYGWGGNDSISGGDGSDYLAGGVGNDTIVADGGANTLIGGTGDDLLVGNNNFYSATVDVFKFSFLKQVVNNVVSYKEQDGYDTVRYADADDQFVFSGITKDAFMSMTKIVWNDFDHDGILDAKIQPVADNHFSITVLGQYSNSFTQASLVNTFMFV